MDTDQEKHSNDMNVHEMLPVKLYSSEEHVAPAITHAKQFLLQQCLGVSFLSQ